MDESRVSNAEIVASFLNVLAGPLARAIVDETVKRGLAVSGPTVPGPTMTVASSPPQGHLCPNCARMESQYSEAMLEVKRLESDIDALGKDHCEDKERAERDWKQMNRMLSKIEALQAELADGKAKAGPGPVESLAAVAEKVKAGRYQVGVGPAAPGGDRTVIVRAKLAAIKEAAERKGRDGPDLDELVDFEDSLPGPEMDSMPAGGNGGKGKPACEKYEENKVNGERVKGTVPPKAHPRFKDVSPAPVTGHIPLCGVRPRAVCPVCKTEHSMSNRGLYPHDRDGVEFRAGRGDRSRPCPVVATAIEVGA